jgi:hypothetical protein
MEKQIMTTVTVAPAWGPVYSQVVTRDEVISYGGGTRARLINDSIWNTLNSSLTALGWFNSGRRHSPITLLAEQVAWDEPITPNTIAFVPENLTDQPWELGSEFSENRWTYYLDFFAEDEDISIQVAGDIMDILRGKLSLIGRGFGPMIDICDYSQPGHYKIGYITIENVTVTRAPTYPQRWMRYMRTVRFEACDYYDQDDDDLGVGRGHWGFQP